MRSYKPIFGDEKGQVFVGYIIGIMIIAIIMVNVTQALTRLRRNTSKRIYQERALDVARQGFEAGLSYFRLQPDGVSMQSCCDAYAPLGQTWVTPWPLHPDSAFMPGSTDTDYYNQISMAAYTANTPTVANLAALGTSMGIVRTFSLGSVAVTTATTAAEVKYVPLWGRYVIRRQNTRNWSPGANTLEAYTDPDAAHDITHMRSSLAVPGSGNYWSLVSRGYVIRSPNNVTLASGLSNTAMYDGGCLLSAPKLYYNNLPFLLAQARVYGELFRINFNESYSAVWVSRGAAVTINTNGILQGPTSGTGYAVARPDTSTVVVSGGTITAATIYNSNGINVPSLTACFPGMTMAELQNRADYVGDTSIFPRDTDANFSERATRTTFYFCNKTPTAQFLGGTGNYVLAGTGLAFFKGNLQIDAGNLSAFNGIVFVNGNVTLRGPCEIAGSLVATGSVTIGNSADLNKAAVYYNSALVTSAKKYLQRFALIQNSVIATID